MRLTSLTLWAAALVGLIVGSNVEANVCRSLYDGPSYETVGKIMDYPVVSMAERGLFSWFVYGNDTFVPPFGEVIE